MCGYIKYHFHHQYYPYNINFFFCRWAVVYVEADGDCKDWSAHYIKQQLRKWPEFDNNNIIDKSCRCQWGRDSWPRGSISKSTLRNGWSHRLTKPRGYSSTTCTQDLQTSSKVQALLYTSKNHSCLWRSCVGGGRVLNGSVILFFCLLSAVEQGLPEDALVAQKPATTALKHGLICILINFKILLHLLLQFLHVNSFPWHCTCYSFTCTCS